MDITSIAAGAGGLGIGYWLVLQAKKLIPAAWSAVKAKLGGGKIDLASIEALAAGKVKELEQGALADLQKEFALVKTDVGKLKTIAPKLFEPAPAAPAAAPSASPSV